MNESSSTEAMAKAICEALGISDEYTERYTAGARVLIDYLKSDAKKEMDKAAQLMLESADAQDLLTPIINHTRLLILGTKIPIEPLNAGFYYSMVFNQLLLVAGVAYYIGYKESAENAPSMFDDFVNDLNFDGE